MTDPAKMQAAFLEIERALTGWWDRPDTEVVCEEGEWFVQIEDRRFSISEQALAVVEHLGLLR